MTAYRVYKEFAGAAWRMLPGGHFALLQDAAPLQDVTDVLMGLEPVGR